MSISNIYRVYIIYIYIYSLFEYISKANLARTSMSIASSLKIS